MADGQKVVDLAREHVGETYVFGAKVPFDNPNYDGPWDCAEFATWALYQGNNIILGCRPLQPKNSEAYTGYWFEDAHRFGLVVSKKEALGQPGAMLCRKASSSLVGHIAICTGDGQNVVEAAGRDLGVVERSAADRPWDIGIRVPGNSDLVGYASGGSGGQMLVFRASHSPVFDTRVQAVQTALKAAGFDPGPADGLFGEWTEKAVINFQNSRGLVIDGVVGRATGTALGLPYWGTETEYVDAEGGNNGGSEPGSGGVYNPKYKVRFESLFPGGFFSSDPDDLSVKRSIRTNNPGALNISGWQQKFVGYVGKTQPDSAGNETTIYRTPEHGTAAWYHLLTKRYGYGSDGELRIGALAARYAGVSSEDHKNAKVYIKGWNKHSGGTLSKDSVISLGDMEEVLVLAKAMFAHEIGKKSPLVDEQIRFAVTKWRAGELA